MGVCVLGMGECGSSSTTVNNMTSTTVNQILTNMVSSTSQSVKATQITIQNASIDMPGAIIKDSNNIGNIQQSASATQTVTVNLDLTSTKNLQNQVATALKAKVSNSTEQKQGFLTTQSTDSNTTTNINEFINNLTSTNITDSTVQEIKTFMSNTQNAPILNMKGIIVDKGSNIGNITQTIVSSQIVNILMKALKVQATNNNISNTIDNDVTNVTKQENSGLGGMITDIIGKITGLVGGAMLGTFLFMMCPAIVLICCVCACCRGKKKEAFGKKKKVKFV